MIAPTSHQAVINAIEHYGHASGCINCALLKAAETDFLGCNLVDDVVKVFSRARQTVEAGNWH